MTRLQCEELLPAIKHFANGGHLWYWNKGKWYEQCEVWIDDISDTTNIIEDKHFEARKAFALGGEIEYLPHTLETPTVQWKVNKNPKWHIHEEYRLKPKEPIYEYQWWYFIPDLNRFQLSIDFYTEDEDKSRIPSTNWTKFEPSKRIRK